MRVERTTNPTMPADSAAHLAAARRAVEEAIERDKALLRIKKKYASKGGRQRGRKA